MMLENCSFKLLTAILPPDKQRTVVVGLILQRNWQPPGVVTQVMLDEFRASQKVIEGGECIARHKTHGKGQLM